MGCCYTPVTISPPPPRQALQQTVGHNLTVMVGWQPIILGQFASKQKAVAGQEGSDAF